MIGFIGVGVMGEPICRHLASKSGKDVRAYDIAPEPLERLKAHGVKPAESVREVAEKSEMVFLSLPGAVEVKQVCVGRASLLIHMRPGTYIIDLSTVPAGPSDGGLSAAGPGATGVSTPLFIWCPQGSSTVAGEPGAPKPSGGIRFWASDRRKTWCRGCRRLLQGDGRARSGSRPWFSEAPLIR